MHIECSPSALQMHVLPPAHAGPYKGPGELSPDDYRSQCGLVVAVVETLSDLGELRLPASLMPHEFLFVREHLGALIRRRDLLLVAQFVTVRRSPCIAV